MKIRCNENDIIVVAYTTTRRIAENVWYQRKIFIKGDRLNEIIVATWRRQIVE
jgi:hypothetical protein